MMTLFFYMKLLLLAHLMPEIVIFCEWWTIELSTALQDALYSGGLSDPHFHSSIKLSHDDRGISKLMRFG